MRPYRAVEGEHFSRTPKNTLHKGGSLRVYSTDRPGSDSSKQ